MVSLQAAAIFSTTIQGILYGCSVLMCFLAMWFMLRGRGKRQVNYYMVSACCALLVLSTAEMGVNIGRVYQGIISKGPFLTGGPDAYFGDESEPTFVAKSVLYNAQTLILDAVVIFRTYIVWKSFMIVIVPIIGWCALLAGFIGLNITIATASSNKGDIFVNRTGQWITASYSLTLATNLVSTLLLALKIWTVARRSAQYRADSFFSPVLRVVLESGAIYSVAVTAALIAFSTKSNGQYIILDMLSPIITIVFNMLIIQIRMTNEFSDPLAHPSPWSSERVTHTRGATHQRADGTFQMTDWKVEITHVVEDDSEYGRHDAMGAEPGSVPSFAPTDQKVEPLGAESSRGKSLEDRSFV